VAKAQKVDEQVAQISSASNEESHGINEVNISVSQMDKVTQSNAANAEEGAASAEELNAQAEVLKGVVLELQKLVGDGRASIVPAQPKAKTPRPTQLRLNPQAPATAPKRAGRQFASAPQPRDFVRPEPIGAESAAGAFKDF